MRLTRGHLLSKGLFYFFNFFTMWASYGSLWAKGDHLMEASYLKAHPFWNRYPEWMPNLHSDRVLGDPKTPKAQAVPLYHFPLLDYKKAPGLWPRSCSVWRVW